MYLLRQGTVPKLIAFLGFAAYALYEFFNGWVVIWAWAMTVLFLILFLLSLIPSKDDNGGWGDW